MNNPKTEGAVRLCVLLAMTVDSAEPWEIRVSLDTGTDEGCGQGFNECVKAIAERFGEDESAVREAVTRFSGELPRSGNSNEMVGGRRVPSATAQSPADRFVFTAGLELSNYMLRDCPEIRWAFEAADIVANAGDLYRDVPLKQRLLGELADSLHDPLVTDWRR